MPTYDRTKVQRALELVREGATYEDAGSHPEVQMGRSTVERHVAEYRKGNRPDIDVGKLPDKKPRGKSQARGDHSLLRVLQRRSASTHAEQMASDAAAMEEEAGRLEAEAAKLRTEAAALRKGAKLLEREMGKAEGGEGASS